ncbi:MAG TPA: ABC transporter permease/substrate-binding protein [Kofleriaceae bacterium]|nr:ABC transporter permease/substrate-binding protein [Kofleriaceae bacterium]
MTELVRGLPPLLASHLALVLIALAIATAVSLPLAIAVHARPRVAFALLAASAVVQTIPGLALLALMVPVLAGLGWLSPFGFAPAAIALTLYAILPILRNAILGLRGVDAAALDAARGLGMTRAQVVRIVQLPLAAPVIAGGIRTATVWTVGAATLATPVGQPCLGNYIFAGLQTRNFAMLLAGVAASAALALVLDALLAGAERALAGRRKRRALIPAGLFALLAVIVLAVLPRLPYEDAGPAGSIVHATPGAVTRVRIGGKTYTEQYILVELMRARLAAAGLAVDDVPGLGSTVVFDALVHGDVDAYVDYSGTLWANAMKRPGGAPRWQVTAELAGWLAREHGVRALPPLGFENTYAIAVRSDTATRYGLHTLADLARVAHELAIGGDYEFFSRPEWADVQRAYGIRFARQVSFDPALLYDALARGQVDAISAFSSDGRIAADDLVVLADPAAALPPYDALILLSPHVASDRRVACALGELHVSIEAMRRANAMVDADHRTPAEAAAWLAAQLPGSECAKVAP